MPLHYLDSPSGQGSGDEANAVVPSRGSWDGLWGWWSCGVKPVTPEGVWGRQDPPGAVCVFQYKLLSSHRNLGSVSETPSAHM